MKNTKITKGPWYVEQDEQTKHWSVVTLDNELILSAPLNEHDEANIRLAYSAPYMAEALEEILSLFDPEGIHPFFARARHALDSAKVEEDVE